MKDFAILHDAGVGMNTASDDDKSGAWIDPLPDKVPDEQRTPDDEPIIEAPRRPKRRTKTKSPRKGTHGA